MGISFMLFMFRRVGARHIAMFLESIWKKKDNKAGFEMSLKITLFYKTKE